MNVPYTLYISLSLPLEHLAPTAGHVAGVWSSVIIIAKMVYQMKFVHEADFAVVCEVRLVLKLFYLLF
jgi:hypothetical protein